MKHQIHSVEDLGLAIRAVRKSTNVRQDDLAGAVRVSRQFTVDVEKGKPTVQLGRVLLLLQELGIILNVEIPDEASRTLSQLKSKRRAKLHASQSDVVGNEPGKVADE
jgi:DNA-binding XRE family transcriptional regulator